MNSGLTQNSLVQLHGKLYFYADWDNLGNISFRQIIIRFDDEKNKYQLKSMELPLPEIVDKLTRLFTWKNKLILLTNHSALFYFDIAIRAWNKVSIPDLSHSDPKIKIELIKTNVRTVIMNDKLYTLSSSTCNIDIIVAFDLMINEWSFVSYLPDRFRYIGTLMWGDINQGESGSIYIALGTCVCCKYENVVLVHNKKGPYSNLIEQCVCDFRIDRNYALRYDIAANFWYPESLNGNFPIRREGAGQTTINEDKIIIFGGGLNIKMQISQLNDCFEYSKKYKLWRMIHGDNKPSKRINPTLCQYGNLIVLFGGYNSYKDRLNSNDYLPLNDLWILNTNNLIAKYRKMRKCRYCKKTRGERRLYKCKGCKKTRYCSKSCQKKHWLKHKRKCKSV